MFDDPEFGQIEQSLFPFQLPVPGSHDVKLVNIHFLEKALNMAVDHRLMVWNVNPPRGNADYGLVEVVRRRGGLFYFQQEATQLPLFCGNAVNLPDLLRVLMLVYLSHNPSDLADIVLARPQLNELRLWHKRWPHSA